MVLSLRAELLILCALVAGAAYYFAGLYTGAISQIGYESRSERLQGFTRRSGLSFEFVLFPVWLPAGGAIRADYEVDAAFGAVTFSAAPPLIVRTPLQVATAYVEGNRKGSVLFVAPTAGWYSFWSDASPLGGPCCHSKNVSMVDILVGRGDCPAYDVSYRVHWHKADAQQPTAGALRLTVPRAHESLVTARIGH